MDPEAMVALGTGALASKDVIGKVLGPSAEYIGGEMSGFIKKCNINIGEIFNNALHKLGVKAEQEGSVNPRVLKNIIDDGRFVEDEVVTDYYGGILAGSKSINGIDDRGLPYIGKLKSMTRYQVRLHFLTYYSLLLLYGGSGKNISYKKELHKLLIFISIKTIMDSFEVDREQAFILCIEAATELVSERLIGGFNYGSAAILNNQKIKAHEDGFVITPNYAGIALFLWGSGKSDIEPSDFLQLRLEEFKEILNLNYDVLKAEGAVLKKKMS